MKHFEVQIKISITNEGQDFTDVFHTALNVVERLKGLDLDFEVDVIVDEVKDA